MARDLAIVLNDGSINAAVTTALAAQKYRPILLFSEVLPQSGSHARAAYDQQVQHFKPYREQTIGVPWMVGLTSHAPTNQGSDPRAGTDWQQQLLEVTPLLGIAARFASQFQAAAIYHGLRVGPGPEELAQATEFMQIWSELLQLPCGMTDLEITFPLLELEPWQVVDVGMQVGAPLDRTWSCIGETTEPCWSCRGCRAREAAFQQAGKPDPLRAPRKL